MTIMAANIVKTLLANFSCCEKPKHFWNMLAVNLSMGAVEGDPSSGRCCHKYRRHGCRWCQVVQLIDLICLAHSFQAGSDACLMEVQHGQVMLRNKIRLFISQPMFLYSSRLLTLSISCYHDVILFWMKWVGFYQHLLSSQVKRLPVEASGGWVSGGWAGTVAPATVQHFSLLRRNWRTGIAVKTSFCLWCHILSIPTKNFANK